MHATMKLGGHSFGHTYGHRTPILNISGSGRDGLSFSTAEPDVITADELCAVRSVRAAMERFAIECERIAAEQDRGRVRPPTSKQATTEHTEDDRATDVVATEPQQEDRR